MNSMEIIYQQFHFLRPWWLLALAPALLLAIVLWTQKQRARQWQQIVSPELLKYLLDGQTTRTNPLQIAALLACWIVACAA